MPKIIENLREKILEEARKQLMEEGYAKTTIRSVASACGIGVGTVYNYFKSKDILILAFMLDDWYKCTIRMSELDPDDTDSFFRGVLSELKGFSEKYSYLFQDKDAASALSSVYSERHNQLRTMLARLVTPACKKGSGRYEDREFLAQYIAESILFFTMSETSIEDQMKALRLLACDE
jgi:AcrR family transcriptional regulator